MALSQQQMIREALSVLGMDAETGSVKLWVYRKYRAKVSNHSIYNTKTTIRRELKVRETNNTPKTVPEEPVKQESNTQDVFPLSMAEMLSLANICKKMGGKVNLINFLQLLPE